jgi:hypothetical protein
MIALEYNELKNEAQDALGDLYRSFTKRVDTVAEKSPDEWAEAWKTYRTGNGSNLPEILPQMPYWIQNTFSQFAALQRFTAETQKALTSLQNDVSEAYTAGLQRGRTEADPDTQAWRGCKTAWDRARLWDKSPWWQRTILSKEFLRNRTKEIAAAKWPDLFTIQNETA